MSRAFLKALGLIDAQVVATTGTDVVGGPKASQISELRGTAKWHDPPKEIEKCRKRFFPATVCSIRKVAGRPHFFLTMKGVKDGEGFQKNSRPLPGHEVRHTAG